MPLSPPFFTIVSILKATASVCALSTKAICGSRRDRAASDARKIVVGLAIAAGCSQRFVAIYLNRDPSTVNFLNEKYAQLMAVDPGFVEMATRVRKRLAEMPAEPVDLSDF